MTQNTEQNVRTREYGEAKSLKIQRELRLSSHDLPALARHARQCFEEGAEEQRRKDAEGQWVIFQRFIPGHGWADIDENRSRVFRNRGYEIRCLYTRPANVAALEADIASLKEAEQLARADAEASKARLEKLRDQLSELTSSAQQVYLRGATTGAQWPKLAISLSSARAALTREGGV